MIRNDTDSTCARCSHFTGQRDLEAAKGGTGYCLIHERAVQWNAWACGPLWDRAENRREREKYITQQQQRESQQQPKEST